MNDYPVKLINGTAKNSLGQDVIRCELCFNWTSMLGTKRCDRCYELETRIKGDLKLAKKIIRSIEYES